MQAIGFSENGSGKIKIRIMKHQNITITFLTLILIFSGLSLSAQYQNLGDANKLPSKTKGPSPWFFGGMIGGGFSSNGGSFEISPLIGYQVTEKFQIGSRLTYIYSSYDYGSYIGRQTFNDYGASILGRYTFFKQVFGQIEYEVLRVQFPTYYSSSMEITNHTVNSLFIGGGFMQKIGGRGFTSIAILYDVLESEYSPYSNPLIRIGIGVGL